MFEKIRNFFAQRKLYRLQDKATFEAQMQDREKPYFQLQNDVDAEKKELQQERRKIKLPSQSKLLLVFLFFNFTLLEGFVGYITIKTLTIALSMGILPDFSPLVTLISLVVGETVSYGIYAAKSKAENVQGGITYDMAMKQLELEKQRNEDGTFG